MCNILADITLGDLVTFITGAPYLENGQKITVSFLEPSHSNALPTSATCANELSLPTIHTTYNNFQRAMITALTFGGLGYGNT